MRKSECARRRHGGAWETRREHARAWWYIVTELVMLAVLERMMELFKASILGICSVLVFH